MCNEWLEFIRVVIADHSFTVECHWQSNLIAWLLTCLWQIFTLLLLHSPLYLSCLYFYFPEIIECLGDPCQNGGTCHDTFNRHYCECPEGYAGPNCERSKEIGWPMMTSWASYQIRKIACCACAGNAGNVFPRHWLQRKPLVKDAGMHHGTCVAHVPWCMSVSLTRGGGEKVAGIPSVCTILNFTYLVKGPWHWNAFRSIGPLWREPVDHRWITLTNAKKMRNFDKFVDIRKKLN